MGGVKETVIDPPLQTVRKECRTTCFGSRCMLRIEHTTRPIPFRLLTGRNRFCQCTETVYIFLTILICFRKVFQDFRQPRQYPAITTCPEILFTIHTFVLGVYVFSIAIVKSGFFIIHDTVCISEVFMQFLQVKWIFCDII